MPTFNDILLIAAAQGALLCVVILSLPPVNPSASRLLAVFVGLESLHLFLLHVHNAQLGEPPAPLLRLLFCLRLLGGPVLFLYVRALTEQGFRFGRRQLVHLWVLPLILAWFVWLARDPAWLSMSTSVLQRQPSTIFMSTMHSLILLGYGYAAWQRLRWHERRLQQVLAAVETLSLRWLKWLMVALVGVSLLHLGLDLLRLAGVLDATLKYMTNMTVTILLIYLISIGGLRQPKVFTAPVREALQAIEQQRGEAAQAGTERAKYQKSGLDEARAAAVEHRLRELLDVERCYLDPALDLPKLARQLGVRPQELSEVISTRLGSSFYDLVNLSRVEAAQALLRDPAADARKMLDIALSVGFSSQSTFYSQFKKLTGKTPSAYRESRRHDPSPAVEPL